MAQSSPTRDEVLRRASLALGELAERASQLHAPEWTRQLADEGVERLKSLRGQSIVDSDTAAIIDSLIEGARASTDPELVVWWLDQLPASVLRELEEAERAVVRMGLSAGSVAQSRLDESNVTTRTTWVIKTPDENAPNEGEARPVRRLAQVA